MEELHQGHPGITSVKGLARGFVWWPGMDLDLENTVKLCPNCQVNQKGTSSCPITSLRMATTSMDQATRLCSTIPRKNVPGNSGHLLQMD